MWSRSAQLTLTLTTKKSRLNCKISRIIFRNIFDIEVGEEAVDESADQEKVKFIYTKDEIVDMIIHFEQEISDLKHQLKRKTENVVSNCKYNFRNLRRELWRAWRQD